MIIVLGVTMELMLFIFEIIGTIAFAISGALAAMDSDMDLMGITVLGITTSVGGGIVRDLTLNIAPPNAFRQPVYVLISVATIFVLLIGVKIWKSSEKLPKILTPHLITLVNISDAIGLAAFTVAGANVAISRGFGNNLLLVIFVGMVTGVGGGVIRDLFTMKKPAIFVKHIYAFASFVGAIIYFILRIYLNGKLAMAIAAGIIVFIRYISAKYKLSLPKFKFDTK